MKRSVCNKARAWPFLLAVLTAVLLSACTSPPSDEHIKIQVARHILPQAGEEIFSLENFRKIDGLLTHDDNYIVEVSYDLVFRKSLDEISVQLSDEAKHAPFVAMDKGLELFSKVMKFGNFKAGERIHRTEIYRMVKTEQGWRLADDFNPERK